MATARSRGAMTGLLLMLLGAWGAIIPFIGHYFGYGFTPNGNWQWTAARWWLEVLPGIATFVAGFLISTTANRATAMFAGWLGAAAGAWFVLGTTFSPLWSAGYIGRPDGSSTLAVWEHVGMFQGLGVVIVLLSAFALGRFSVVGVRDVAAYEARRSATTDTTDGDTATTGAVPAGATRRADGTTVYPTGSGATTAAGETPASYDKTVATDGTTTAGDETTRTSRPI
jgi:hypothetical protein